MCEGIWASRIRIITNIKCVSFDIQRYTRNTFTVGLNGKKINELIPTTALTCIILKNIRNPTERKFANVLTNDIFMADGKNSSHNHRHLKSSDL